MDGLFSLIILGIIAYTILNFSNLLPKKNPKIEIFNKAAWIVRLSNGHMSKSILDPKQILVSSQSFEAKPDQYPLIHSVTQDAGC